MEHLAKYDVPIRKVLKAWSYGFTTRDAAMLSLSPPQSYFSSLQQALYLPTEPGMCYRVEDKESFYALAPNHLIPETYTNHLNVPDGFEGIIKPKDGVAGRGVYRAQKHDMVWVVEDEDLLNIDLENYIFQEEIEQAAYAEEINPHSVNTIRILTINPEDGDIFVPSAVHRFGSSETAPTDNWSQGGCAAPIDVDSGKMELMHFMHDGKKRTAPAHPESLRLVQDKQIPNWDGIVDTAIDMAEFHEELSYVGWDVVLQKDGTPVILEGNAKPHLALQQLGGGLLEDKRVRDFFRNINARWILSDW